MMELDKHIAVFDNVLSQPECQDIIDYWEWMDAKQLSHTRRQLRDSSASNKSDTTVFPLEPSMRLGPDQAAFDLFLQRYWDAYGQYLEHYDVLRETGEQWIRGMRVQKTEPGQGYHQWHYENDGPQRSQRVTAWMIYLNDIEQGGETEFLYQHKRVEARTGRLVVWPAGFTHVHRGNAPLEGTKYVLTGWCEW